MSSYLQELSDELFFLFFVGERDEQIDFKHVGVVVLGDVLGTYCMVALYLMSSCVSLSWISGLSFSKMRSRWSLFLALD